MSLRNKLTVITVIAVIAILGVGFAAWTFTNQATDSAVINGKATAAIEANGLRVTDGAGNDITTLYLICDAPAGQEGLVAGNGIYWATDKEGQNAITALTLFGTVNEDDNDIADITTYTGLFTSTATAVVNGTYVNIAATTALNQEVVSASKNADVQTTFTLPTPSYASVPTTVAEVNALQTEVNALSLTFSFTFKVVSVA